VEFGTCSFYRDDEDCDAEKKERYKAADLKQGIYPGVVGG
jgi:hypothetical protein